MIWEQNDNRSPSSINCNAPTENSPLFVNMDEPKSNVEMHLKFAWTLEISYIILIVSVQNMSQQLNGSVILYPIFLSSILTAYVDNCINCECYDENIQILAEKLNKINVPNFAEFTNLK